jgi:hypothetical protein
VVAVERAVPRGDGGGCVIGAGVAEKRAEKYGRRAELQVSSFNVTPVPSVRALLWREGCSIRD